jgi:hypothetical protein
MEALLGEAPDPPYAGAGAGAAAVGTTHQSQQHQLPLPLEPAIAPPETSAADTTGSNSDSSGSSSSSSTRQKEEEKEEGRLTVGDLVRLVKGPTFLTLLGLCYLWFCASLSYYGIAFNSGNLRCAHVHTICHCVMMCCVLPIPDTVYIVYDIAGTRLLFKRCVS